MNIIRRIDSDGDATITYNEFAEYLRPQIQRGGPDFGDSRRSNSENKYSRNINRNSSPLRPKSSLRTSGHGASFRTPDRMNQSFHGGNQYSGIKQSHIT